jgi:hypothetical protein
LKAPQRRRLSPHITPCNDATEFVKRPWLALLLFVSPHILFSQEAATEHHVHSSAIYGAVSISGVATAGATIQAFLAKNDNGHTSLMLVRQCISQETGACVLQQLEAGQYYLFAEAPVHDGGSSAPLRFGFYYKTHSLMNAELIHLGESQQMQLDVDLEDHPLSKVAGRLIDFPKGTAVQLWFRGKNFAKILLPILPAYDRSSRTFAFKGVPPGEYYVRASWQEGNKTQRLNTPISVVGQNIEGLVLQRPEMTKLVFSLEQCEHGEKIKALNISRADGDWIDDSVPFLSGRGSENGSEFVFENVPDGTYFLHPANIGSAYISSIPLIGEVGNRFSILDGGRIFDAAATVRCDASSLQGKVIDDGGEGLQSNVIARSAETNENVSLKTDSHGSFDLRGLAPGQYDVLAIPTEVEQGDVSLKLFEKGFGQSTQLPPGKVTSITISPSKVH